MGRPNKRRKFGEGRPYCKACSQAVHFPSLLSIFYFKNVFSYFFCLFFSNSQIVDIIMSMILDIKAGAYRVGETGWDNSIQFTVVLIPDVLDYVQHPLIIESLRAVDDKLMKKAMNY